MEPEKSTKPVAKSRRKIFTRLLLALVLAWGFYLLVGNGLLRTAWLQNQLSRKPSLDIRWQTGHTLIPGKVHLKDFRIEGHQRAANWHLTAAQVSGWVNLLVLPLKDFRASHLKGHTVVTQIARVPNPPPKPNKPPGWKVSLKKLDLKQVQKVHFDGFELVGDGRAHGTVTFRVRDKVDLSQAQIDFKNAELSQDGQKISRSLTFTLDGSMDPFKPGAQPPRTLLNLTNATLDFDGKVSSLGFLHVFLEKAPWLKLSGGGHVKAHWILDKGRIAEKSTLKLTEGDLQAQYLNSVVIGRAAMNIGATSQGLKIQAGIEPFDVIGIEGEPYVTGSGFEIIATSKNLQLDQPFDDLVADIRIPESNIPDITVYNAYLPQKTSVKVKEGKGRLAAKFHFEAQSQSGHGEVDLWGESVVASVDDLPMAGKFHLKALLNTNDLMAHKFELSGSEITLEDVYTGSQKTDGEPWMGKVVMDQGTVVWKKPMTVDANMRLALQDSSPIVALMAQRKKIFEMAQDLLTVKNLIGTGHLRLEKDALYMSPFAIKGEKLEVLGQLKFQKNVANGKMFVKFRGIKLGIALENSKRDIKWTRSRKWYAAQPDIR